MQYIKIVAKITDEIIPFDIEIKEKEGNLFTTSRILDRPIKRKKYTGDNDDTRKEKSETLPDTYLPIPHHKTPIDKCSETSNQERHPKSVNKFCDKRYVHISVLYR